MLMWKSNRAGRVFIMTKTSILGRKIGMTQVFSVRDKIVPVTAIDLGNWIVTGFKTKERDGYDALQIGLLREKYVGATLADNWVKHKKTYFVAVREIEQPKDYAEVSLGMVIPFSAFLQVGQKVNVQGTTRGKGFQGVVKRHGFTGGRASHGPRFGRIPGSIGFMRSQGRVIKGKKLPGHLGNVQRMVRNLEVIQIEVEGNVLLVKGAIPGVAGSLVSIQTV